MEEPTLEKTIIDTASNYLTLTSMMFYVGSATLFTTAILPSLVEQQDARFFIEGISAGAAATGVFVSSAYNKPTWLYKYFVERLQKN